MIIPSKPSQCSGCPLEKLGCGFVPDWTGPDLPRSGPALGFLAEAPGQEEVWKSEPMVGPTGRFLEASIFVPLGIRREQLYIGNVIRCRPKDNIFPGIPAAVSHCRVHDHHLKAFKPELVILTYHPAAALRNRSVFPLIRAAVKKALVLSWHGHRVLVALGDQASSLLFPKVGKGGLRAWHNHLFEYSGAE